MIVLSVTDMLCVKFKWSERGGGGAGVGFVWLEVFGDRELGLIRGVQLMIRASL